MMFLQKKKRQAARGNRVLINVNVMSSTGPIRLIVYEEELVDAVIGTDLKSYARQGRHPVLGSDLKNFLLYSLSAGETEVLSPSETIGTSGARNFLLCKKPQSDDDDDDLSSNGKQSSVAAASKSFENWMSWLNKLLSKKIYPR